MATSDSINLAQEKINQINSVKRSLRSVAESGVRVLNEVDSILVNTEKKAILLDGLAGLSVDANELKAEKDALQKVVNGILNDVPKLTR